MIKAVIIHLDKFTHQVTETMLTVVPNINSFLTIQRGNTDDDLIMEGYVISVKHVITNNIQEVYIELKDEPTRAIV
jgi:hypothetical protein